MLKIDTHQHFWRYNAIKDSWITDDMSVLQRDFFPVDVLPLMNHNKVAGSVAVQADQSEKETEFLLSLAGSNPFIKGIVGWVDLQADNLEERLIHYKSYPKLKGFRHILQAEAPEFMLNDKFTRGIALLGKYNYTYDILITQAQIPYADKLVKQFPDQKFVIDHLAKPAIKSGDTGQWGMDIKTIAGNYNVYCKLSGFCTEADWYQWKQTDVTPYFDIVVNAFGINRLMYGSDWPVCMLAGGYNRVLLSLKEYLSAFSEAEQELFWSKNAIEFYDLKEK